MAAEEATFLEALRADAADDETRLVYADWLEERGDPRAEYLRLEVSLHRAGADAHDPQYFHQRRRLTKLDEAIDPSWAAVVRRALPPPRPEPRRVRVAAPERAAAPDPRAALPALEPDAWRKLGDRAPALRTARCGRCRAPLDPAPACPSCGYTPPSTRTIVLLGLLLGVLLIKLVSAARDPKGCLADFVEREYRNMPRP